MSSKPRILAFAGSLRTDSLNKKLIRAAAEAARSTGGEVTVSDLRDYPLPLFDGDHEAAHGLPENAKRLKEVFFAHQGLFIASPEYNSSVTAVLKNALDWVSRPLPGEVYLAPFHEKVAALLSASPGALGGLRGLVHLRAILGNIGVLVLPDQLAIPLAHDAFGPDGKLKDTKKQAELERIASRLVRVTGRHHG